MLSTDNSDVLVPGELIYELSQAYQSLVDCCDKWKVLSEKDEKVRFEVYVPTFGNNEGQRYSNAARRDAVAKSVALTIDETVERKNKAAKKQTDAGIICASDETVSAVENVNAAKKVFKATVLKIRDLPTVKKSASRETALKQAMKSAGIQTLDLRECYRQIRIMPPHLEAFSWTWATSHARIQRLTFNQAMDLAEGLRDQDEKLADTTVDILRRRCSPDQPLVRRVTLPNQLRANYVYRMDGDIVRKSCPVSGVVIAQQSTLPRLAWRPNPMESENDVVRLPRESIIEKEPIIDALRLHRYVERVS